MATGDACATGTSGAGIGIGGTSAAGVIGAGVIGAGVIGVGVIGVGVIGAGVIGAGVIGAGVIGAGVIGAGVIGAGAGSALGTGSGAAGASPPPLARRPWLRAGCCRDNRWLTRLPVDAAQQGTQFIRQVRTVRLSNRQKMVRVPTLRGNQVEHRGWPLQARTYAHAPLLPGQGDSRYTRRLAVLGAPFAFELVIELDVADLQRYRAPGQKDRHGLRLGGAAQDNAVVLGLFRLAGALPDFGIVEAHGAHLSHTRPGGRHPGPDADTQRCPGRNAQHRETLSVISFC
ncbi:MAG: hypothetical protein IPG66_04565 [Hydrogenophilales bacterium]|nr:hypothetical protein [Hydrogenophilales bacterium]